MTDIVNFINLLTNPVDVVRTADQTKISLGAQAVQAGQTGATGDVWVATPPAAPAAPAAPPVTPETGTTAVLNGPLTINGNTFLTVAEKSEGEIGAGLAGGTVTTTTSATLAPDVTAALLSDGADKTDSNTLRQLPFSTTPTNWNLNFSSFTQTGGGVNPTTQESSSDSKGLALALLFKTGQLVVATYNGSGDGGYQFSWSDFGTP
ncbi:MAG: hypothetical protein KC439_15265 [Yoonia sp.]|nr:hypothetical protein [Yoonia sp.]